MYKSPAYLPAKFFLLAAIFATPAFASAPQIELKPDSASQPSPDMISFAHAAASTGQVVILAESAQIKVVRDPNAADITIAANCPRDWNVQGSVIRQAGFTKPRNGVAMMADSLGSRAIVNGKIYPMPSNGMKGLQLSKDGVSINGEKVEPLQGSDVPGNADGPDKIEVLVPDSYSGSLVVGMAGGSQANISSWKNGDFKCTLLGNSKLEAGTLSTITKAAVDLKGGTGDGPTVVIADVSAKVLVANVNSKGSIDIHHGSADVTNATVSGDGVIKMKGRFDHLEKAIEGKGSIQVN